MHNGFGARGRSAKKVRDCNCLKATKSIIRDFFLFEGFLYIGFDQVLKSTTNKRPKRIDPILNHDIPRGNSKSGGKNSIFGGPKNLGR